MKLEERVSQLEFQIKQNVKDISENTERIDKLDTIFVRLIEFLPVKNIVYGLAGLAFLAVATAVINSVLK